eukprot:gene9788-biopygen193
MSVPPFYVRLAGAGGGAGVGAGVGAGAGGGGGKSSSYVVFLHKGLRARFAVLPLLALLLCQFVASWEGWDGGGDICVLRSKRTERRRRHRYCQSKALAFPVPPGEGNGQRLLLSRARTRPPQLFLRHLARSVLIENPQVLSPHCSVFFGDIVLCCPLGRGPMPSDPVCGFFWQLLERLATGDLDSRPSPVERWCRSR